MTLLFGDDTLLEKMKQDKMAYTPFISMSQKWSAAYPQKDYQSPVEHYPSDGDHRGNKKISRRERNAEQERRSHHSNGGAIPDRTSIGRSWTPGSDGY